MIPSTIGQVLCNLLIVLFPIYFYQWIFTNINKKSIQLLAGIVFGVSSILSMEFPVVSGEIGDGLQWDLRLVPLIICTLYIGKHAAIICTCLLAGYSLFLDGAITVGYGVLIPLIPLGLFLYIKKNYHHSNRTKKYLTMILNAVITSLIVISAIWIHSLSLNPFDYFYQQPIHLFIQICTLHIISLTVHTYFTENVLSHLRIVRQIHETEKLNIVSELAASIAHEIRNPLTVVRGFIQLTKGKVEKDLYYYMDTAIDELERAESIISDYLNFAKPNKSTKIKEFKASNTLNEIILLMQSFANINGITLNSEINKDLYIVADPFKFKQALLNLVKNAIEATNHGSVNVSAYFSEKNKKIIIKIIDTGTGMSLQQLHEIGKPYFSTKSQGTGLGLMVTLRLIESMQGSLTFNSELGKGTTACIMIKGTSKNIKKITTTHNRQPVEEL